MTDRDPLRLEIEQEVDRLFKCLPHKPAGKEILLADAELIAWPIRELRRSENEVQIIGAKSCRAKGRAIQNLKLANFVGLDVIRNDLFANSEF